MHFYYYLQMGIITIAVLLCSISFTMNIAQTEIINGQEIDTAYVTVTNQYYLQSAGRDSKTREFDCLSDSQCLCFENILVCALTISILGGIVIIAALIRVLKKNEFTTQNSLILSLLVFIETMACSMIGSFSLIQIKINNEYYEIIYGTLVVIMIYTLLFLIAGVLEVKMYLVQRNENQNTQTQTLTQ